MKLFRQAYEQENGLPVGYTEVEYLESTGTQYIDTGYIPKPTATYKSTFQLTNITTTSGAWFCVFGSVESGNTIFTELFLPRASGAGNVNQVLAANHNSSNSTYIRKDYAWAINTPYDFEMTTTDVSINGVSQGSITVDSSVSYSHSIYLFARHENDDSVRYNVSAKIHSFKILEGNTLVHNFIPVIDPLNIPCMYDLVGKKAYYNKGTGEFTAGRQIHLVEYLESSGTQYIDTSVIGDLTTELTCEAAIIEAGNASVTNIMGNNVTSTRAITINMSANIANPSPSKIRFGNTDSITVAGAIDLNTFYKYTVNKDNLTVQDMEGTTLNTYMFNATTAFTTNGNILIYKLGDTSTQYIGKLKISRASIKNNDVLVRDLIPAIDENNTPFMFDKVTHTAYLNAGTGNFAYGKDATKYKTRLCFVRPTGRSSHMLPKGFTEVEYLESTGTQYIDTGFVPTSDNFQFEIRMLSQNTSAYLGYRSVNSGTATGDMRWFFNYSDGRVAIRYGNGAENSTLSFNTQTTHKFYFNGSSLYVDDVNYLTTTKKYTTPVYKSFYLFSVNTSGYYSADIANFIGRIYYTKIWDNDVLVRDYIPALDSNNRPCMYDRVEGKAYYNQGTGSFTAGKKIIPVEYLESTGAQYINTGIASNLNTAVEMNLKVVSYSANNTATFFGGLYANVGISTNISKTNTDRYSRFGTKYTVIKNLDIEGIKSTVKINKDAFVVNGQSYDIGETDSFNGPNMYLFKADGITSEYNTTTDVYGCKIWDTDTLVRNFIPVIDEDNTAYMFDRVTHTLFANAGTGEFLYGDKKQNYYLAVPKAGELLPAAYRRLEYIEGTGTQYINTDTKVDANTKFILDYQMTDITTTTNGIFGASSGQTLQFLTQTGQGKYVFQWTPNSILGVGTKDTDKHRVIFDIPNTNISVDDDTVSMASWTFDYPTGNIMLFVNGHLSVYGRMKAYGSKIYNGNTLVRHFIPALRKSDNKPGMYDAINNVFYTNAATGADFSYA